MSRWNLRKKLKNFDDIHFSHFKAHLSQIHHVMKKTFKEKSKFDKTKFFLTRELFFYPPKSANPTCFSGDAPFLADDASYGQDIVS